MAPFGVSLPASYAAPDLSLDCVGDACGNDLYEIGGYSRWTFFQYLSERFGTTFARDVLATGAALADPAQTGAQLLAATLAARGTTLGDVFNDYTAVHAAARYAPAALQGVPPAAHSSLASGSATGALPVQRIPVNHLASRYLRLTRGSGPGPCWAATLSLTVALPAGGRLQARLLLPIARLRRDSPDGQREHGLAQRAVGHLLRRIRRVSRTSEREPDRRREDVHGQRLARGRPHDARVSVGSAEPPLDRPDRVGSERRDGPVDPRLRR